MDKFKLSTRLALGFGIVVLLMVISVGFVLNSINTAKVNLDDIVNTNVHKLKLCVEMNDSIHVVAQVMRSMMLVNNTNDFDKERQKIVKARQTYDQAWEQLQKMQATEKGLDIRATIDRLKNETRPVDNQVIELVKAGRKAEAYDKLTKQAIPLIQSWQDALASNIQLQEDDNQYDFKIANDDLNRTWWLLIIISTIAIGFSIFVAVLLINSIVKPINRIVGTLNEGAQQVASASEQLSNTSQQLAEGSSEQASAVEETSSSLEESSSMINQNSEHARIVATLSAETKTAADKGNHEMEEMMQSMDEIKKSSDQISKIIKIIDQIAFQTNILALNAAVEAARAGDAGLGFSVVAEEVRNLAQRSSQAAKDISSMIESNIALSENGVDIARRVYESLIEIAGKIKKVNELNTEIAEAGKEQSLGIVQISKAIAEIEKATQNNAASAEESAAASEELNAQADVLLGTVDQLLEVVNGKQNGASGSSSMVRVNRGNQRRPSLTASSRKSPMLEKRTGSAPKRSVIVNPEDVIPLNDDTNDF